MFKNYFKIGVRSLLRNKVYSFINIGGLALGMASFLLIIHYVRFERSYEDFHVNANNIARVTLYLYKGTEYVVTDCETNAPFAALAKEKLPEVTDYVRLMHNDDPKLKTTTKKFFNERSYFADPSVFRIFSFKIISGDANRPLSEPYQVVLTEGAAKKYFGRTDVVGEMVELGLKPYKVTAVMADVPPNTHLKFEFLVSHATIPKFWDGYSDENWETGNNEYTYLLLKPNTDFIVLNQKLRELSASLKGKIGDDRFVAEPIKDIHLYSSKTFEPEANGNARTVYFLLIIACFIIVLAWVNYINLSTAKAMERAREVGIRKVMGSQHAQLMFQFLAESAIINLIALFLALIVVRLGLPLFRDISGQPLPLNLFKDSLFWYLLPALLLVGTLLSGLYPAIVLASFEPVKVLKGKLRTSAHGQWMRKGLVVFQFAASAVLIVCLCTVYLQIKHLRSYDLGMNIDQTLVINATDINLPENVYLSRYHSLKSELLRQSFVQNVARSSAVPGLSLNEVSTTNSVYRVGQDKKQGSYNYYHYMIDADFISTFGMKLSAGRNFESELKNQKQVIINEEAVRTLGFTSAEAAIGEKITYNNESTIVGVVKNFSQRSPKEKQRPMIFWCGEGANYFSIKMKTDRVQESMQTIRETWSKVFPSIVFIHFFMDDNYNKQYQADAQFGQVIGIFSVLAIFIACLGLFGLSSFTILQRTKEIGIRKVLGSSVTGVIQLLTTDFVRLILIAGLIAVPIAYLVMKEWLSTYEVRIDLTVGIFLMPVIALLLISLLTVSVQTVRAARANPVDSLRSE
ncbi:MAG: ABC transporter permease [Cyclobacteriaceae bacterium]